MALLFFILGIVGALALVTELFTLIGRDALSGERQRVVLIESIRKTQAELRTADKKLDGLRTTRRNLAHELDSSVAKYEEMERDARRPQELDPILIFPLGIETFGRRFRARITKTLTGNIDPNQSLLWVREAYVEMVSDDADTARAKTRRHFPESSGYALGPFTEIGQNTESAA